ARASYLLIYRSTPSLRQQSTGRNLARPRPIALRRRRDPMHYGYVIPSGDPRTVVDLAVRAEEAGWDGVFYWDGSHFDPPQPVYDAWVVLAAIAARTERV